MKVVTLAAYLDRTQRPQNLAALPTAAASPPMTRGDEIEAARRHGEAEGREAARLEHAAELQREQERVEARLAEMRKAWTEEQSEVLSRAIGEGLGRIEAAIADAAARLIEPLLVADAREAALVQLKDVLEELLTKSPAAAIRIQGPDDLLAALRDRLGERKSISYAPGAGCDVLVETDNTLIETRLKAWMAHLQEAKA